MTSMTIEQTRCPDEGCGLEVPNMAEGLGWMALDNGEEVLLFCPYHWPTESRRLHRYAQATEFYHGNIGKCEHATAGHKEAVLHVKALARMQEVNPKSAEVKRELARLDALKAEAERRIPILKGKLDAEIRQHEQENEALRSKASGGPSTPASEPNLTQRRIDAVEDRTPSWDAVQPWEMPDE